jgi:hypothetical protein
MIRRDIRTNSLVDDEDVQDIRNEIVDILSDASLNEKLGEGSSTDAVVPLSKKSYFENPEVLQSLKVPELRTILRYYKDAISFKSSSIYSASNMKRIKLIYDFALNGSKQRMIERIARFFTMDSSIIHLQKIARGRFVRQNLIMRGPALKNRSICVNNTDFYSMEPVAEIEFDQFFSYSRETPTGKYVYGFDHNSLLELLKNRTSRLQNPYNREDMTSIIPAIRKVERLQKIVVNSQRGKLESSSTIANLSPIPKPKSRSRTRETLVSPVSPETDSIITSVDRTLVPAVYPLAIMRANIGSESNNYDIPAMISKIRAIRLLTFAERSQNLFMEIDQLGNYTQVSWFMNLTRRDNMRYYRLLHDIWSYRAQMSNEIKRKICPMWDPFSNFTNEIVRFNILTDDEIRSLCLRTMEDIIFTGVSQEFRVLGAFHALSALTIVSIPARNSMMWLYESVMY